jgi:hypothetical protein
VAAVEKMLAGLRKARLTIRRAWQESGPTGVISALSRIARTGAARARMHISDVAMDLRLGVRTRGFADNEDSVGPLSLEGDPHAYEPIHADWWRRCMSALPPMPANATFVDLGAGRGRPMILAARMGFRRIVGVELDPVLAGTATRNVQRWKERQGSTDRSGRLMTVVQMDAATYPLPEGPLVIFMANPFGPETLRRVLQQVVARHTVGKGDVVVVYFNPVHEHVFGEYPSLSLHDRGADWAVYRLSGAAATA